MELERAKAILQRDRKKRLEAGHPWVFASEINRVEGEATPGDLVDLVTHQGRYLATGYWNPRSQITVRIVSYKPIASMDKAFFVERFSQCAQHRSRFVEGNDCRLVYGEADFLPGLIVDRFGGVLVVQLLTLGMDARRDEIIAALVEVFAPQGIYERSDVSVRELEGLEQRTGVLYGDCPRIVEIIENGLKMEVDIVEGQKTGYFFDQRENRASIAPLMLGWGARSGIKLAPLPTDGAAEAKAAQSDDTGTLATLNEEKLVPVNANGKVVTFPFWDGATVLECFAHTGSFTLHACKYGAKKVTCLDVSEHAIDTARSNVIRNGFEDRVEFVVADAFEYLRKQVKGIEERHDRAAGKSDTSKPLSDAGRKWDVVILDPPAFTKSRSAIEGAVRGYKDINLHGLKLVNEGGYLVTASCSYHMRPDLFLETIQAAAIDAGKTIRLIEWRAAGKDHPQIVGVNEGHYLKFGIFEVRSR
ncbi:class I SAM-dependent rRNA methyltransferase [Paenibacillus albus]|uniref:Class I SAM-dependent rRNA methyltransferase n=1 Tax=Paenibacillus albus TaxID=2495582 RepID=A0A3S9A3Z6_9BACL|nr:class I SAM-dependent rRNA methyltransferase [Paenibacillus albus]AZN40443.1 class I SAM-dependent rRNA methyltransferase [Paenibacillus albus]